MSASRVVRNGAATPFSGRVLLAMVTSLVLTAAACSGEASVEETAADGSGALDERARPADRPTATPTGTALRRGGEVITFPGEGSRSEGDLVAQDPDTGEERTLVAAEALIRHPLHSEVYRRVKNGEVVDLDIVSFLTIGSAAWSADGRWVAYQIVTCLGGFNDDEAGEGGLWVTNGVDEPRQLTRPCLENPDLHAMWAWSPVGAQLAVADGDALGLIDPATGDRTDLGDAAADVTTLTWSPDGTRIVYGTMGGSVYSVGVSGGDHSALASSLGESVGGVGVSGFGIGWSPDGARIAVQAVQASDSDSLYLMNADGSGLRQLAEGLEVQSVYLSPGLSWSPDGTRMAYATSGGPKGRRVQIWTASPDGSNPSRLYESAPAPIDSAGSPVWSADGARIAFKIETTDGEAVWLVANADGTGDAREIDELRYLSWRGGWYFCGCYG